MAIKTHKVTLSLDNPRVIQSGINVQSFDKQSIQISIELTKNDEVFQVPSEATIRVSLLKLARQEQKIIVDVPNNNRDSIDWIVPDYLDGYQGTVRVGVYLVSGTENVDLGYFTILSNVSDIDKMADEFTDNVFQGWEQIEADLNDILTTADSTIANINAKNTQVNTLASDFTADVATKQSDVTSKHNAFDTSVTQAGQTIDDILALQPQFQSVLDETTGKDVISGPEVILARNGKSNLKTRLDEDHAQVNAQLAQTEQSLTAQLAQTEQSLNAQLALNEQEINKLNPPHKISDLKYPLYVAHRGAMGLYQEHTMIAYESHVLRGNTLIELDVRQSKDGSLFIMHDSSIYRTTNGAGNVSDMTTAYLKNRKITDKLPTRISTGTAHSYQPEPIPSLNEVLDKFGKSVTYFIESKDQLSASLIAKEVIERNLEKYVVIQSFSLTDLKSIKDEGIEMLYLSNSIQKVDYTSIKQTKINFIGVSASVPDDYVLSLKNAGFKVLVYTVNHRYLRDKFLSLNVDGFFSDEPFYLSETNPVMKVDNFREKLFLDGMIPMYGSYKGEFNINTLEPHTWGFLKDSTVGDGRDFVLQGYLDKQPNAFSLNVTITKPMQVTGSWASIAVCLQNDYFDDNKNPQLTGGGYHMIFSSGGQMFMYLIEPTGAVKLVEYVNEVNEWKDNSDAQLRITVTNTEVKFERLDIPKSIKVANTKYRGGYITFGRKNANYLFKNVSIT